jgi:hypothetical protein
MHDDPAPTPPWTFSRGVGGAEMPQMHSYYNRASANASQLV